MLFQTDYCFRRTSGVNPHTNFRKDVTDAVFTRYIRLNGAHQLFIDCSRCSMVSPQNFHQLGICETLQYLDVSFTGLQDLNIIAGNLHELRALNLAGLNIATWEPLKYLTTLESLSLRLSSKVTNKAVSPLRECLRLRSLNLGYTDVSDVSFSKSLTRLEELVLDGSKMGSNNVGGDESKHEDQVDNFLSLLASLPVLRVLNLANTPFFDDDGYKKGDGDGDGATKRQRLLDGVHPSVYVERKSREHLFLQSIIDSDTTTFRRLVSDGAEIDKLIGLDARHLLLHSWQTRCTYKSQRLLVTPFFQIDHSDAKLRPRPIHLAILFNAFDILADLVAIGADLRGQVWFGDMKAREDGAGGAGGGACMEIDYDSLEDYEEKKKEEETKQYVVNGRDTRSEEELRRLRLRRPHIYSLKELCANMGDRNCHRLVMDMVARKVSDWKVQCQRYSEDLAAILDNRYQEQMVFRADQRKREEQEARAAERRKTMARKRRETQRKSAKTTGEAGSSSIAEREEKKGEGEDKGEEEHDDDDEDDESKGAEDDEKVEEEEEELFIGPLPWKKPGRKPLELMSNRNHALTYRDHGLYARLNAPAPYVIPSEASGRDKDHYFLGKRDFWLESRAFVLEDRLLGEAAVAQALVRRREEDKVFALNYRRNQRVYGSKEYVGPGPSEPQRQDMFKTSLKKTIDRKFIVREDSEEEEEDDDEDVRSQVTLDTVDTLVEIGAKAVVDTGEGVDASYDEPAENSVDASSRPGSALNPNGDGDGGGGGGGGGSPGSGPGVIGKDAGAGQDEMHMSEQLAMQLAARGNFGAAETVLDAQEKHQHETAEEAKTRAQKMEDKHHLHLARHKVDDKHQEEETREKEAETRARI